MLFFLSSVYLSLLQWLRQRNRRQMYNQAICQAVRSASVLIQRLDMAQGGSTGVLRRSRLLNCSSSYRETRLFEDQFLAISAVEPKQRVLLGSWTSYLDLHPNHMDPGSSVMVLLEAQRHRSPPVPPGSSPLKVHVLQHGSPIAWKPGNHFGVILHCSLEDFARLCDAFGQGCLTMGEDLLLERIITVKTEGRPHSLLQSKEQGLVDEEAGAVEEAGACAMPDRPAQVRQADIPVPADLESLPSMEAARRRPGASLVQPTPLRPVRAAGDAAFKSQTAGPLLAKAPVSSDSAVRERGALAAMGGDSLSDFEVRQGDSVKSFGGAKVSDFSGQSEDQTLRSGEVDGMNSHHAAPGSHHRGGDVQNGEAALKGATANGNGHAVEELMGAPDFFSVQNGSLSSTPKPLSLSPSAGQSSGQMAKPPNVLVFCGKKDSVRKFEEVKATLELCVNTDRYVLYHLKHDMLASSPWADNCELVVLAADIVRGEALTALQDYLTSRGKVLSFTCSLEDSFVERQEVRSTISMTQAVMEGVAALTAMRGRHCYVEGKSKVQGVTAEVVARESKAGEPLVVALRRTEAEGGQGHCLAIFSQLMLERDPTELAINPEMFSQLKSCNPARLEAVRKMLVLLGLDASPQSPPPLTPAFLVGRNQKKSVLLPCLHRRLMDVNILRSKEVNLALVEDAASVIEVTASLLPLVTGVDDPSPQFFDLEAYWSHLQTETLGQMVVYVDVVPSTMHLLDGMMFCVPEDIGLVAIAGRQTAGKGRGGNSWLSPPGCAMFSAHVRLWMQSELGSRVSFLQHLAALAVVQAVTSLPGYQDIDLRLKWPNDIYFGADMKVGGVIVNSTTVGNVIHSVIGCGVNVSNSQPTICINDVIALHNRQHGDILAPLTTGQLVALTLTQLERLMEQFQREGRHSFCHQYYQRWLHGGAVVQLQQGEGTREVRVRGLDDYGFLQVEAKDGSLLTLQPDGNSFDMMRNLICTKAR